MGRGGSACSIPGRVPRGWAELGCLWSPRQHSIVGPPQCGGHSPAHTAHSPARTIPADSPHCARGFARGNRTPQGRSLLIVVGTCRQHPETRCCHRVGRGTVGLGTVLAEPAVLWAPRSLLTTPGHSHPLCRPGDLGTGVGGPFVPASLSQDVPVTFQLGESGDLPKEFSVPALGPPPPTPKGGGGLFPRLSLSRAPGRLSAVSHNAG